MSILRTLIFALAWAATIACSTPTALGGNDNCLTPEIAIDPDLSKLPGGETFVEKLKTPYGTARLREVRYDFSEVDQIVRVKETFILDFSEIISGIGHEGYRQTKARENCNTTLNPAGFALTPHADGNLRGGFSIDTTFRACQIFDVPCIEDGYKITMCSVTWKEDIDRHTFGVDISIARVFYTTVEKDEATESARAKLKDQLNNLEIIQDPIAREAARAKWEGDVSDLSGEIICQNASITGRGIGSVAADYVSFCGSSQFDERGYTIHDPVKNFLLNVIGIATLNIGSKFILDTYNSKLSDTRSAVDKAFSANLPGRTELIGRRGTYDTFMDSMKINQTATAFRDRTVNGRQYVAFYHIMEHPQGQGIRKLTFCSLVRPVIAQYGALLRSTVDGDKVITIDDHANLWTVAKSTYGSGYYYLTLLQPNDIAFRDANRLKPGARVTVPAMYKIWTGTSRVVKIGDSLWSIAKSSLGNGSAYENILAENTRFIDRPNRIYPIQLLNHDR